jgi:dihydrofolate synthase/folylpolyglutamate synthase
MSNFQNASVYQQAEAYIYDIPKFTTKNNLEHTREILSLLGNAGMNTRIIHVAGTNGKGSVCAFLESMLRGHGLHTGMFISPHLLTMCERIRIDGVMITEQEFYDAFTTVRDTVLRKQREIPEFPHPTFFEFLFLMGMVVFEQKRVDVIILETGLGGRKDATNVVKPQLSVITEIGLDHCQYLGDTKEQIAWEKAGIIKENTPVVYSDKLPSVSHVIEEMAHQKGAETFPVGRKDYRVEKSNHKTVDFSFHSRYYSYVGFTLATSAIYQAENAALALRAFEVFCAEEHYSVTELQDALRQTRWEGRMDEVLPQIYVDGAHNTDGVMAFLDTVRAHERTGRNILLFGVVSDKAYPEMVRQIMLSGLFDEIVITGMEEERAVHADELQEIFTGYTTEHLHEFAQVAQALSYARSMKGENDRLYIAGSLYLVGYVLPLLKEDSHD